MDQERPGASGKKVVVILVGVVLLVSASASWFGMSLRSDTPHTEEDHPDAEATEEADTGAERARQETEDFMREIGYVQ